jgi:hypothetical protein
MMKKRSRSQSILEQDKTKLKEVKTIRLKKN